jgi:Ca2+-binding RTX toxin-like protein
MPRRSAHERRRSTLLSIATICAISLPATALLAASPSSADEDTFAGGKKVSQGAIAGDSSVAQGYGDITLTDGVGATWFLSTAAVSASDSASASGSASEASFTNPTVASTIDGGTESTTLSDAFDGYNTLSTFVGTPAPPSSSTTTSSASGSEAPVGALEYSELGAQPTTSCDGRSLDYPAQVNGALTVSRKVFVPSDAGYARWTNTVTNTSDTATTATLYIDSNMGSDSDTRVFDSSTGDTTGDMSDSWVGTFQNWRGTTSSDPRTGHVLQGDGASSSLIEASFVDGNDNLFWTYQLALAPGQTRSILNYTVVRGTQAEAADAAAAIAANAPGACMSQDEANAVSNFKGLGAKPVLTLPPSVTRAATGANGAVVTYAASAKDGNNQPLTPACTPPSGSVFKVGTTTVTCTATDAQGRVTTGTFSVTVTAAPVTLPSGSCDGEAVTIVAKPGVPTLGTAGKDVILGTTGADTIEALGGDDVVCGLGGDDTLKGGDGDDKILGGAGDDKVLGAKGDDTLLGRSGDDKLSGGAGDDAIKGRTGDDKLKGGGGADRIIGGAGDDTARGGAGKDRIRGNRGDDVLTGGPGKDNIKGGRGKDTVDGKVG